ncbi:hypothetical protein U1Q18_012855, partial [Sarracenia purpurea var. burkii]
RIRICFDARRKTKQWLSTPDLVLVATSVKKTGGKKRDDRICAEAPSSTAAAPTSDRIPALCSTQGLASSGLGFSCDFGAEKESQASELQR